MKRRDFMKFLGAVAVAPVVVADAVARAGKAEATRSQLLSDYLEAARLHLESPRAFGRLPMSTKPLCEGEVPTAQKLVYRRWSEL